MLEIKNIVKKFNNKVAVNNISFTVGKGEIVSLIGPNGSGKTTIIKMISGLLSPSQGEILVSGNNVVDKPKETKKDIGYIPDEPAIWPYMTGEEFLRFTGALFNMNEKDRDRSISQLLDMFDLSGVEKEYFENYSRGNKQKFSILAALLHRPELLLIDEPIVGLDPLSAIEAQKEFKKFANEGGSVLLVTHTLSVAQKISNRIGLLDKGKLVAIDTFSNLCTLTKLPATASLEEVYEKLVK
ncbi:MAG: ABC transporter ATP-binding protein [Candidatus Pacebacteria bacterium]|nr:ABC transporter ATP-binding protein [Candidatus Paceibacterota bacterium]